MLYRNIVHRMVQGENYYAATAEEHRLHLYSTSPPKVFREPTLAWLLTALRTNVVRQLTLFALSIVTLVALRGALVNMGIGTWHRVAALILISSGLVMAWTPISFYKHEGWAGLLIALSLACYRPDRWLLPILLGVLARLIRELSLPYLGAMAAFALFERRWKEFAAWIMGIAIFVALFVTHLVVASHFYHQGDVTFHSTGWINFGG